MASAAPLRRLEAIGVVGEGHVRPGGVDHALGDGLAGQLLDALVDQRLGLGRVGVDEVGGRHLALEEALHHVGVVLEERRPHDEVGGHVLAAGPEGLLVDEDLALALLDHPGGPGLGNPGAGDQCRS